MKLILILLILTFLSLPAVVNAVDPTTVGGLQLVPTYESIGIYSNFTGDDNGNNFASFRWRESGGVSKQGMNMTVDRRTTVIIGGEYGSPGPNPYVNQFRASIIGVNPNTAYEVEVTFSDPEGVTGTNPVSQTITTRNDNIQLGTGSTYYVSPAGTDTTCVNGNTFATIQQAVNCVQAGDTVYIRNGTYREQVTISRSGTANNWITFMNYGTDIVTIDGEDSRTYNMNIGRKDGTTEAHYIRIKGLRFVNAAGTAIDVNLRSTNIIIEDNYIEGFRSNGIFVGYFSSLGQGSTTNITIQRNTILRTKDSLGGSDHLINFWQTSGSMVVRNNVIKDVTGLPRGARYWDCIGGGSNYNTLFGFVNKDSDIYGNYIEGCNDDGIEAESGMANVRIWNNTVNNTFIGIAYAPIMIGPLYVFRNVIETSAPDRSSAFKLGQSSAGLGYFYHNTIYFTGPYDGFKQTNNGVQNIISRNNILRVGRYVMEFNAPSPGSFNYDALYTTDTTRFVKWGGATIGFSAFQSTYGQELNGTNTDAQNEFVDAANGNFNLKSNSQLVDKGVVLTGFNDINSPWPYKDSAPDIGAFEYDSGAPPTFGFTLSTSPTSGTVVQGSSITTTVTATLTSGTTQSVSFTASGLPSGASPSFSPTSCNPICSSTLTISTISTTPAGTYTITITGTGGGLTRTTSYSLTVSSATDTTPPTASISINSGASTTSSTSVTLTLTCTDISGVNGVRYSNDGVFDTESWESFASTKAWGLTSGDGTKTVWYQCRDNSANQNIATVSDTIVLNTTPGTGMNFTFIADITTEETALGMVEYNNDLYIAAHTNPKNTGSGTIIRYNDLTGVYGTAYSMITDSEGLGDIRVINNRIYVTSMDFSSTAMWWSSNGSNWQPIATFGGAGLLDIDYYNNRYYVAGYSGAALLYSSADGITDWTLAYSYQYVDSTNQFPAGTLIINRFRNIAVFKGKMFFTPQISNDPTIECMVNCRTMYVPYEIFSYNGTTFTPIEFSTEIMEVTDMEVFNNALYLSIWSSNTSVTGMYRTTDGINFLPVSFFGPSPSKIPRLSDLITYDNKLYAADYVPGTPPSVVIYESSDGTNWAQVASIPATVAVSGSSSWINHITLGVYNGRLYVIPPAQGRLYVLSVSDSDTTPPIISNIASAYSTVSANITWNTDDLSNSTVNYGTTTAVASTASGTSLVTSHRISVIGLLPNTTYYYRGTSCNSNNLCNSSSIRNFTTNALPPNEVCVDSDNDNFFDISPTCTGGNDCNDASAAINPSAAEVCGNSIDENCDNIVASCTACPDGSIPAAGCSCGGVSYYSGYCCSNAYQTSDCPQPPSPPPSGGGGGGVVTIGNPVETPITKEPETKTTENVSQTTGTVSLEITTPIKVESGEMFNATVWLLSSVTSAYSLIVADMQQEVSLEANKEMLVTIPVRAPEARGSYTLTATVGGTVRANDIELDYLPLFLYVSETRVGNETFVNITVKNYESMSTELRVIKDGRSDAFFELIEGKKEYNRQLKLTQAGEYKIVAAASSQGKIIDTDEYLLTVGGERKFDYRLIVIIVFAVVVMVITLLSLVR